jgi:uncharacterized protein YndB with AHSA1/START domain
MPTTHRTRTIAAPARELWELISDPHHLPRWWPRVTRVEGVEREAFTEVLASPRGRLVRADFQVVQVDEQAWVLRWAQCVEDTPFARLLVSAETELRLEPLPGSGLQAGSYPSRSSAVGDGQGAGEATAVTIELNQVLRGFFPRLGASRVRRAARATLEEALDGLERIVG